MTRSEFIRWIVVASTGGYGLYYLADACGGLIETLTANGAAMPAVVLATSATLAAVYLAISLHAFLRQDRQIAAVVSGVLAFIVLAWLLALPRKLGIWEFFRSREAGSGWLVLIMLPVAIVSLIGPFYGSAWFFRLCLRVANRFVFKAAPGKAVTGQAQASEKLHRPDE